MYCDTDCENKGNTKTLTDYANYLTDFETGTVLLNYVTSYVTQNGNNGQEEQDSVFLSRDNGDVSG